MITDIFVPMKRLTPEKKRKLLNNMRTMLRSFRMQPKIHMYCGSLSKRLNHTGSLESLTHKQLHTLKIVAQMKIEEIDRQAEEVEGSAKGKLMLEASAWRNHIKSLETMMGAQPCM